MRNIKRLLVLLLISLTGIVSAPQLEGALLISQTNYTKEYLHKKMIEEEITELESSKFSPQNLQKYLSLIDIRGFGKDSVILRQAIVESAWFKSKLFIEGNNLFGMKLATTRPTTAIGKCRGHAKYKHWTDSVKDIILYQIENGSLKSRREKIDLFA